MSTRLLAEARSRQHRSPPGSRSRATLGGPGVAPAPAVQPAPAHGIDFARIAVDVPRSPGARLPLQAKLAVNAPGDALEQEADRLAGELVADNSGGACGATCEQLQTHQSGGHGTVRRSTSQARTDESSNERAPPVVHQALASPGEPLRAESRGFFEPRLGYDLGHVRVHADPAAARSALAIDALAYTVGRDIVFAPGQYEPGSERGRRLIAHELVHVAQQGQHGTAVQRQGGKTAKPTAETAKKADPYPAIKGPASGAPKLEHFAPKGTPCAVIVFIHNNERNARKIAQLIHKHCSYHLLMVSPDNRDRYVRIPNNSGQVDPNGLFDAQVAEQCLFDPQSCRDFMTQEGASTDPAKSLKYAQMQFFMALSDASNNFKLPVIALHNNDVNDTATYRAKKDDKGVDDLVLDIDKTDAAAGKDQVEALKKRLVDKFGKQTKQTLTEVKGKTNIFRWCSSSELTRCHIGDPHHPDHVVWVTRASDFDTLKKTKTNVVLQDDLARVEQESKGDLSTLFLELDKIVGDKSQSIIQQLLEEADAAADESFLKELLLRIRAVLVAHGADTFRKNLRFVNVETPGKKLAAKPDDRIADYEFIVETLKALGLHCCGGEPAAAEQKVKDELKTKDDL